MKTHSLVILLVALLALSWGGAGTALLLNEDGTGIVIGQSGTAYPYDDWIAKIDSRGYELWSTVFGRNSSEQPYAVTETRDGGYVVTGRDKLSDVEWWSFMTKFDRMGNVIWSVTLPRDIDRTFYTANSIVSSRDNGQVIAGLSCESDCDLWLLKTDALGNEVWSRTYGGDGADRAYDIARTRDNGYIVVGVTNSYPESITNVWLIKTDAGGNELWSATFGGERMDVGNAVAQTRDNGYIVVGTTTSYGEGYMDALLIKTDALGNRIWLRTFGGRRNDKGFAVAQTRDNGYIIAGGTKSFGEGSYDAWLIKTDALGNEIWSGTFGVTDNDDLACAVAQTKDNGYILLGRTTRSTAGEFVWLIKTDSNGNVEWESGFDM